MSTRTESSDEMTTLYGDLGPTVLVEAVGSVRVITMNAPERLNSFDHELHESMRRVWDRLIDDDGADAIVLTGAGRAFSAGGHVHNFIRNNEDPVFRRKSLRTGERMTRAMLACELPIVAAVNGPAIGLGANIAILSDIVVMADTAYIVDPHVSVGVVAGDGGPMAWPLLMSLLKAKEYLLLCEQIDAEECLRVGLANHVVAPEALMPKALHLAQRLSAQPRAALRDTKRALNLHLQQAANLILNFTFAAEEATFAGPDVRATAEKFAARSAKS
jgi:enoyl-CoA hydratase